MQIIQEKQITFRHVAYHDINEKERLDYGVDVILPNGDVLFTNSGFEDTDSAMENALNRLAEINRCLNHPRIL